MELNFKDIKGISTESLFLTVWYPSTCIDMFSSTLSVQPFSISCFFAAGIVIDAHPVLEN